MSDGVRRDRRAVSTTLSYVLALGIAALLVASLIAAGGSYLDGERRNVVDEELSVVGERIASGVGDVDRLAGSGTNTTAAVRVSLPATVAGSNYRITVHEGAPPADGPGRYVFELELQSDDISRNATVRSRTPVDESTLAGGDVYLTLDADENGDPVIVLSREPLEG